MNPRNKVLAASLLLGALVLTGASARSGAPSWPLIIGCLVVVAAWLGWTRLRATAASVQGPRLKMESKLALTPRAGIALVSVESRRYLVTYGEGGTQVRPLAEGWSTPEGTAFAQVLAGPGGAQ